MKISIVSPSYKRIDYFENTIDSILSQKGDFDLEYIVQDGGGDDRIKALLEKTSLQALRVHKDRKEFSFYIEPDNGMYDAINRGFSRASGDIFAWLNTDDMYHPYALSTVARIFAQFPEVHWITGIPNSYNIDGARVGFDTFPPACSRTFLQQGFYDVKFVANGFNWIQQESTFWRRDLWQKAGPLNSNLKYAADFHLWQKFAQHTELVKVHSFLGGFRVHENQLTNDPDQYRSELPDVSAPEGLKLLVSHLKKNPGDRGVFLTPDDGAQKRLNDTYGLKREELCGRTIRWSHQKQTWQLNWELIL